MWWSPSMLVMRAGRLAWLGLAFRRRGGRRAMLRVLRRPLRRFFEVFAMG